MVQLHTLGAVNLRRDGTDVRSVLSQPRRLAILVYLATARPRDFHSRDRLIALFWPESDESRARNALRQAIHQLRRSLGSNVVVGRGDREIGIDRDQLWCDATAFEEAIEQGRLESALELYRGDFLPGFFVDDAPEVERFIEDERLRLRRAVIAAAWRLAESEEARGNTGAAAARGRHALSFDPLDEASVRRVIDLLDRSDERAAALQLYGDFARRLEAEMDLEPSAETVRLIERLRAPAGPRAGGGSGVETRPDPVLRPTGPGTVSTPPQSVPSPPEEPPERHASTEPATPSDPPSSGQASRRRWLPAMAAAAILVVALGFAIDRVGRSPGSAPAADATDAAIAVLPFINMSGDPANEYFSDGMTEELAYALSRVPGLRVVGHTSAFRFKGKDVAADSIGRALRVPYLLEGSVRATGQRVRIVAQLIDAASGYHIWSNTWDGELIDVFEFQAEISRAVVRELVPRLVARAPTGASEAPPETSDPEAYADVLRGYQALFRGELEDYFRADTFFSRAIRRDPDYARAHAGLAAVYMIFDQIGLHAQDPWRRTVEEADLARRLDPTLPAPHSVLARVAQLRDWDFETADRLAMRAIELAPGEETWYRHRALLLSALGQHEEAIAMGRRSVELDPLATGAHRQLGGIFFNARRFAEGLASVDQALALSPGHGYALMRKAAILSMLDRHSEAAAVADSSVARDSDDPFVVAISGWVHARAGDTAAARHWLRELEQRTTGTHYARAIVHTGLGENERAIELLEAAFALRYPLLFELAALPVFDPLRGDPRIDRLLREIGVPPCDDCPGR